LYRHGSSPGLHFVGAVVLLFAATDGDTHNDRLWDILIHCCREQLVHCLREVGIYGWEYHDERAHGVYRDGAFWSFLPSVSAGDE
jgi:hypothetical protein